MHLSGRSPGLRGVVLGVYASFWKIAWASWCRSGSLCIFLEDCLGCAVPFWEFMHLSGRLPGLRSAVLGVYASFWKIAWAAQCRSGSLCIFLEDCLGCAVPFWEFMHLSGRSPGLRGAVLGVYANFWKIAWAARCRTGSLCIFLEDRLGCAEPYWEFMHLSGWVSSYREQLRSPTIFHDL
jgi:hypothetical protein